MLNTQFLADLQQCLWHHPVPVTEEEAQLVNAFTDLLAIACHRTRPEILQEICRQIAVAKGTLYAS